MGKLRRCALIAFVIAAVLGVGVLAALWFAWEPLLPAIAWLAKMEWFFVVEAILLAITAVGLLTTLVYAIAAPGKKNQLMVKRNNGSIAITQNAIKSTVRHVVASHNGLTTGSIQVDIAGKREPRLRIHAKIDPGRNAELNQLGIKLQDEIAATLEAFSGYAVDSVDITFSGDADVVTPAFTHQATHDAQNKTAHQPRVTPAAPVNSYASTLASRAIASKAQTMPASIVQ